MAHGKDQHKITTTVKGILKRPHEDASKHSNLDDSLSVGQGTTATIATELGTNSSITERNITEAFDSDDTEQPFASLTDEEKQIIGLMSHPTPENKDMCTNKSSDAKVSTVSNAANASSSTVHTSVLANTAKENEAIVSYEQAGVNTVDAYKEAQVVEVKNGSSGDSLICSDVQKNTTDTIPMDCGQEGTGEPNDLMVTKDEAGGLLSKKRKSVQLKTPGLDLTSKRRKSQSLPCATDSFPTSSLEKCVKEDKKFKILKGNGDSIKQENVLHQFFKSSSKLLVKEEIDCSMKKPSLGEDSTPRDMTTPISPLKKEKTVLDKAVSLKQKTPVKELPEENAHASMKKNDITETEINFFGPTKKASKSNKDKEKKSKGKTASVKTSKATKREARGLEKRKDLKGKFFKGVTILISDDSDTFSPPNCDSGSEEDGHLKRIWDDFEPQTESVVSNDSPSPLQTYSQSSPGKKMSPVVALSTDGGKQPSLVNTLGLGKKQRVAHTANHVRRIMLHCS